jgi:hypothetical protein
VTDFTGAMGYCEFQIPFFIEGVKVETAQMAAGTQFHEQAEKTEREAAVVVPLTRTELEDRQADLNFIREDIQTMFFVEFELPRGRATLELLGRADKVMRQKETLIISDDKHTHNPARHDSMMKPYSGQLLQVLAYLHSVYYLGDLLGWSDIPHGKKAYQVNIIDSRTGLVYKTYEDVVGRKDAEFLFGNALRFTQKCLNLDELVHHNSKAKCKACGFFNDCDKALR